MRSGMWCVRGVGGGGGEPQPSKLSEDCDREQLAGGEMNRTLAVGSRPSGGLNSGGVVIVGHSAITPETGAKATAPTTTSPQVSVSTTATNVPPISVSRKNVSVSDASECHLGNMVISSYCCVVLIIFALLFILIGSILTYAITQYSNVELVQFLNKYEYLRVASPLMICLGLLMFIPGVIFWVAKRWCRRPRAHEFVNSSYTNSFFPPDVAPSTHSSQGSLMALSASQAHVTRPRNSLASTISSRTVSPLLQPLSGDASDTKGEWRWPSNHSAQLLPPPGSFPPSPKHTLLSPSSAECPSVDIVSESNVDEVMSVPATTTATETAPV